MFKNKTFCVLVLFGIFLALTSAESDQSNEQADYRTIDDAGDEYIYKGQVVVEDSFFGHIPMPNTSHEIIKIRNGKELHRTQVEIDKNGFRLSPASHRQLKSKHLLLIGSSSVFGEGLKSDQTLFHLINIRSKVFEAYPLAFYGYGPQHAWLNFKLQKLLKVIRQKKGRALLFIHEGDFARFFGMAHTLSYTAKYPFIEEIDGQFVFMGNFLNNGRWWQKLFLKYCSPFRFCSKLFTNFTSKTIKKDQLAILGRLFEDIEKMYREQFDVEDFQIVWKGSEYYSQQLEAVTKVKITNYYYHVYQKKHSYPDGHTNSKGMRLISDFLFENKIIH